MRVPVLPIVASFALLAAPAFAQNSSAAGTTSPTTGAETTGNTTGNSTIGQTGVPGPSGAWDHGTAGEQSGVSNPSNGWSHGSTSEQNAASNPAWHYGSAQEQSSASSPAMGWHQGASVTADTRQKIAQSLEQSGFKDVRVTPEAFVIHAQAPDGSHVVMLLRPDEVTGVIEQSGSSAAPNGAASGGSPNSESGAAR